MVDSRFFYVITTGDGLLSFSLNEDNSAKLDAVLPEIPPFNSMTVTDFAIVFSADGRLVSFRKAVQPTP